MSGSELSSVNRPLASSHVQTDLKENQINISTLADPLSPVSPANSDGVPSPLTPPDGFAVPSPPKAGDRLHDQTSTKPGYKLGTSSIDHDRPFKVVVIGAGFSGIIAGIRSDFSNHVSKFFLLGSSIVDSLSA